MCSRGTQLEGYVITSLVQLLCRTTKLCWFDDDHFRTIVEDAKAFLTKGTGGSPVSFKFWQMLGAAGPVSIADITPY